MAVEEQFLGYNMTCVIASVRNWLGMAWKESVVTNLMHPYYCNSCMDGLGRPTEFSEQPASETKIETGISRAQNENAKYLAARIV
jgi:hypothetical protein